MRNSSGDVAELGIVVGRAEKVHHLGVGRDVDAVDRDGDVVRPAVAQHGRVEAQALLDGVGEQLSFGDEALPPRAILEEPPDGVGDERGRRLVARDEHHRDESGDLVVGREGAIVQRVTAEVREQTFRHDRADRLLIGTEVGRSDRIAALAHLPQRVGPQLGPVGGGLVGVGHAQRQLLGPVLEPGPVLERQAEQVGEGGDGEG